MSPQPIESAQAESESASPDLPLRIRYRIRFAKTGLLRWTSHRDLARLWERIARRAQLNLSMTEGFHPKPRIGFPSALALGVNGLNEVAELDLAESLTAADLLARLTEDDQPGLRIKSVQRLPEGSGKAKLARTEYRISCPDPELVDSSESAPRPRVDAGIVRNAIDRLLARESVTVSRKGKPLELNVAAQILLLCFDDEIHLSLAASDSATLKPNDVLDLIECSDWVAFGAQITRTDVVLTREFQATDPEFIATNQLPDPGKNTEEVPE